MLHLTLACLHLDRANRDVKYLLFQSTSELQPNYKNLSFFNLCLMQRTALISGTLSAAVHNQP